MLNFAYFTSFQKNDIGWPQQPPTEKMLRFNMIFYDSTQKNFFQSIKIKLNYNAWITLRSLVVLCSLNDLSDLNSLNGINDLDSLISVDEPVGEILYYLSMQSI